MKPYDEQAIQNFCDRLVPKNQIFLNITSDELNDEVGSTEIESKFDSVAFV